MGNMSCGESSSGFMSHRVDNSEKGVGKCHSCQALSVMHLLSCVHVHIVGCRQIVQDHFNGLKSQRICKWSMKGRYIGFNSVGQGVHSCVGNLLYRKTCNQIRINDGYIRGDVKVCQRIFHSSLIIGNNREGGDFCGSS